MGLVFSYARTSVDDGMKISVDAQLDAIDKKVISLGLKNPIRFSDKGVSGATDNRPSFNELKQTIIHSNEVGFLYVWRYDRIFRNTKHLLEFLEFCEKHHIQVRSVTEVLPGGNGYGSATQTMFMQVLGILAETQRNVTIENINATLIHKKKSQQYLGSTVPIGYKLADKQVVQDLNHVQMIKRIFELYVTGNYGYKKLQNELIKEGFYYKNQPLTVHRIQAILSNPLYYGWIKGGKLGGYYGDFEPIVSKKVYDQAQAIKARRNINKKDQRIYPLRKKVHCPFCHWFLSPKKLDISGASHSYYYYHCANRKCQGIMISAKQLECEVLDQLRLFLGNKKVINSLINEFKGQLTKQQKQDQKRVEYTEREQKKIIEKYEEGELPLDELKQNLKHLDQRKPQSNDYPISENEVSKRLNHLLQLKQESVKNVIWNQIENVVVGEEKQLKGIYLTNLSENILQLNGGENRCLKQSKQNE